MPIHRIQGPDGKIHRIEAPANASPEQLVSFVASSIAPKQQDAPTPTQQGAPAPAAKNVPSAPLTPELKRGVADAGEAAAKYEQELRSIEAKKAKDLAALEKRVGKRTEGFFGTAGAYQSIENRYMGELKSARAQIDAARNKQKFIQERGRAPSELTTGQRISEPLRGFGRGAIESTAQLGGLAGVFGPGGEEVAKTIQGYGDSAVEALGLKQSQETAEALEFDPSAQEVQQLSEGAGSIAPYLFGGVAKAGIKGAGMLPAAARGATNLFLGAVATGQGATQARQQVDQYEKETGQKVDPFTRQMVHLGGGAIGLTELIPIPGLIGQLPSNARVAATNKLMSIASKTGMGRLTSAETKAAIEGTLADIQSTAAGRILTGSVAEGAQEGSSQFLQNVQERVAYNEEKRLSKDVAANAYMGLIIGGGVRGGTEALRKVFPGGPKQVEEAEQALQGREPLESIFIAMPSVDDPTVTTREKVDIFNAPDAAGYVVVRRADGKIVRMKVGTLDSMRVPENAANPVTSGMFGPDMILGRLQAAAGDGANTQTNSFINSINRKLSNDIALDRPQAAADYISKLEKRFPRAKFAQARRQAAVEGTDAIQDPTLRVVLEAKSILNDYRVEFGKAQTQPGVAVGTPTPSSATTLAQLLERNQQAREEEGPMRAKMLQDIATDPSIIDKPAVFDEALARYGYDSASRDEVRTLLDVMRMESAYETAAGASVDQEARLQQAERTSVIEDLVDEFVGKQNYSPTQKISMIDAELLRNRQPALTESEAARIQKRLFNQDVFGPGGEFARSMGGPEEDVDTEEAGPPTVAETATVEAVQPENLPVVEEPSVPVTKVTPDAARSTSETRRGAMGTQQGRPVEGAAELTEGMLEEQELNKRLNNMRNANLISDADVGDVMRMIRVPTTRADLKAMPPAQQKRWKDAIDKQLEINQRAEELSEVTDRETKKKLTKELTGLRNQLDGMRKAIAKGAQQEAAFRVAKRKNAAEQIEADYKAGKITKAERNQKMRERRVSAPMGPVLSIRQDAASELLTNPQADMDTLDLSEAPDIAEGTEQILAALQQAVADGKMSQEQADFATWVLSNNPNLTRYAALFISANTGQGYTGSYNPMTRLIEVVAGAPDSTAVHEVLHHAERLMPQKAQDAIYALWETRLAKAREASKADDDLSTFFNYLQDYHYGSGKLSSYMLAISTIKSGRVPRSYYQFATPSEFWAENATGILRQRFGVSDSIIGRIKQWLKEFASRIGAFVGDPTRSTIIRTLNQLANTTGEAKSPGLIEGIEGPAFMVQGRRTETTDETPDPSGLGLGANPNISRASRAGIMASLQQLMKSGAKRQSAFIRKLNYKYQDVVDYDAQLAAMYGVEQLPNDMALSHKAELLEAGRSGQQMSLDRNYIKPILNKIADLELDLQDVGMYLWARSAKDRNAVVRTRNAAFPEAGSGMSDAEAAAILKDFALRGLELKLDQVAKMHDNLVDFMLNTRVKEGLLTRKQANEARKLQPFYTPLKGFAAAGDMQTMGDEEVHNDTSYKSNLGIRRTEYMKSAGRASMPLNPLTMLFADAKQVIQRASVNRVGQQLLTNLLNDPEANIDVATYYTDSDPKIRVVPNENVEYPDGTPLRDNMRMERDKYLVVKKDGVPYYIEFAETDAGQSLRRAFDNMTPKGLGGFMRAWLTTSNALKSLLTRYSPAYLPRALVRDVYDAVVSAYAAETEKGSPAFGKKLGAKVAAYTSMTTKTGRLINGAVSNYVLGKEPQTDQQAEMLLVLDQMVEDGGSPGHAVIHDLELLMTDAQKYLKQMQKLKAGDSVAIAKQAAVAIPKALDAASQMIDFKARLATYVAALEEGIDREGAARLALNSSLNLTRRGEWARGLDATFFFFSPSVESARRFKRLGFNSSNGRKIILGQMALGAIAVMWNAFMGSGDDDDDGRPNYMDIPDGVKQTSLVLMTGPGADDYVAIPLGFMVGFPTYVGQKLSEASQGAVSENAAAISIVDSIKSIAAAAVTTLSPVKPRGADASQFITSMLPNIAKPFGDLLINRNYFDSPIYQEQFDSDRAASTLGREDTGEVWKWIARSLNDVTGGSGAVSGGIDAQPEALRYLFEAYAGGLYRTAEDTYKFATEDNDDDKTLAQRLPIVRSYVGKGGEFIPMSQFYKNTQNAPVYGHPGMGALIRQREYEPEEFNTSSEKYPVASDWRVLEAYAAAKSELDSLGRDRREELEGVKDAAQRKQIIEYYRKLQEPIYKEFNRAYNQVDAEAKK